MKTKNESGIALISVLLILVLLGALLEAFIISINSEQETTGIDREQKRTFYGAMAGLEELTARLGNLFASNFSPTGAQINALTLNPTQVGDIEFKKEDGTAGYEVVFQTDAFGNPARGQWRTINSGPFTGLQAQVAPYTVTTTARTSYGAETRLRRELLVALVPVFQFGIFSDTDLSFFAGPNFNFGGRVHTNGNLYLAEGDGSQLTLPSKVTTALEVVRTNLSNGWSTGSNYNGQVRITTGSGYRNLAQNEGSLVGTVGSSPREPGWTNLTLSTYNGNILSKTTGGRPMNLPLVNMGAVPIDLIQRPATVGENPSVLGQRFFSQASLRILLSDTAAQITALPGVTATQPVSLTGVAPDGTTYAVAGAAANGFRMTGGLIGGFIKIEMRDTNSVWQDVTQEILALGIAGHDWPATVGGNPVCADQPNAILRFQRYRDIPAPTGTCPVNDGTQFWPNALFDTREGTLRDNGALQTNPPTVLLSGVMHYVELDVSNLARWFRGLIGASGSQANTNSCNTGYLVYFSDRRMNLNSLTGTDTGEYGFEDFVNRSDVANGQPNGPVPPAQGLAEIGEDVNANNVLDTYGAVPQYPTGAAAPLDAASNPRPNAPAISSSIARVNKPLFFRRAIKLVNGAVINLGMNGADPWGLSIASENPLYVQGNYNANGSFDGGVASAILADSVTLLSNRWNDRFSFNCPYSLSGTCAWTISGTTYNYPGRIATTTWYKAGVIAGKGLSFNQIGASQDYGTDGGVHNFLRFLENWGGQTLNYRGSIVSLYYNRQAVGTYKCCTTVYSPPTRGYNFDTNFLSPNLLPPCTPVFRDINVTSFTPLTMPNQ